MADDRFQRARHAVSPGSPHPAQPHRLSADGARGLRGRRPGEDATAPPPSTIPRSASSSAQPAQTWSRPAMMRPRRGSATMAGPRPIPTARRWPRDRTSPRAGGDLGPVTGQSRDWPEVLACAGTKQSHPRRRHVGHRAGDDVFGLQPFDQFGHRRHVVDQRHALSATQEVAPRGHAAGQVIGVAALRDDEIVGIEPGLAQ